MSDHWNIRVAEVTDEAAIANLVRQAFAASEQGEHGEAQLIAALRADGDSVIELVAEADVGLVGHIMFSRMTVTGDGALLRAAALAPVSVRPSHQGSGIGASLIHEGLARLRADDWQIVFVLGSDKYYPRFGFAAEKAKYFASPFNGPYFMAALLDSDLAVPQRGQADYAPAFGRM